MNAQELAIFELDGNIPTIIKKLFNVSSQDTLEHRTVLVTAKLIQSNCFALESLFYIRPLGEPGKQINYSINLVKKDHYENSKLTKVYSEDLPGALSKHFNFLKEPALDLLMDLFSKHIDSNSYQCDIYVGVGMIKIKYGLQALVLIDESKVI